MESFSHAEFMAAAKKVLGGVPANFCWVGDEYERVVAECERERRKWNEELFSPAGLKIIFRR